MGNFRTQIEEDIRDYQDRFPNISKIKEDDWAFNFWILDKFFYEDEELIEDKILDDHDRGIDVFEYYEDTHELFIVQNKYYSEKTHLSADYVKNNFLVTPISILENGTYTRSSELQDWYTKHKDLPDFTVHLDIYVTNNSRSPEVDKCISEFNNKNAPKFFAKVYYLDDIEEKFFGEPNVNKKKMSVDIESINKGTILNVDREKYNLGVNFDARYAFVPVTCIYRIYKSAVEKQYPIFEKNIREYLGNKGINHKIFETLKDKDDRKNFFYYNNGITMICDTFGAVKTTPPNQSPIPIAAKFQVVNPQIVNGCQTVNSIFEALRDMDQSSLDDEFKDTYVMVKILQIDRQKDNAKDLFDNIVKYNNSQNSIDEKSFAATSNEFVRLQNEFLSKGYLLLIKQSDKEQYSKFYKQQSQLTKLRGKSVNRRQKFGFENAKAVKDFFIPLEKLLQVIIAFQESGYHAYNFKKDLLKITEDRHKKVIEFIKSGSVTTDALLDLYLLYMRAEKAKKDNEKAGNSIRVVPFYLIDCFSRYDCEQRQAGKILDTLKDRDAINNIIAMYSTVTNLYTTNYIKTNSTDYTTMIKKPIDTQLMDDQLSTYKSIISIKI